MYSSFTYISRTIKGLAVTLVFCSLIQGFALEPVLPGSDDDVEHQGQYGYLGRYVDEADC